MHPSFLPQLNPVWGILTQDPLLAQVPSDALLPSQTYTPSQMGTRWSLGDDLIGSFLWANVP